MYVHVICAGAIYVLQLEVSLQTFFLVDDKGLAAE